MEKILVSQCLYGDKVVRYDAAEKTEKKFFGENFNGVDGPNPNNTAAPILKELYTDLVRDLEAGLLAQTHLKP